MDKVESTAYLEWLFSFREKPELKPKAKPVPWCHNNQHIIRQSNFKAWEPVCDYCGKTAYEIRMDEANGRRRGMKYV